MLPLTSMTMECAHDCSLARRGSSIGPVSFFPGAWNEAQIPRFVSLHNNTSLNKLRNFKHLRHTILSVMSGKSEVYKKPIKVFMMMTVCSMFNVMKFLN